MRRFRRRTPGRRSSSRFCLRRTTPFCASYLTAYRSIRNGIRWCCSTSQSKARASSGCSAAGDRPVEIFCKPAPPRWRSAFGIVEKMDTSDGNILFAQTKTFSTRYHNQPPEFHSSFQPGEIRHEDYPDHPVAGLKRDVKKDIAVLDVSHGYKYSEKHFKERTDLYRKFYRAHPGQGLRNQGGSARGPAISNPCRLRRLVPAWTKSNVRSGGLFLS